MTMFDDVYLNYERIANKYQELAFLLIKKLIKYKVQINSNESISFKQLVHKVNEINVKKEYDYKENIKPSDDYVFIKAAQKYTGQDVSVFNQALSYRTMYYIRWLRYYLAKKGVDLSLINKATTLKEHIYLIDFIAKVKNTNINITINNDNKLYYGKNTFHISVIDEDGNYITNGKIEFIQDGLRAIQDLTEEIVIDINDLNEHTFKFKYYNDNDIEHYDSEIILTLIAQPRPVIFTASLMNTQQRNYINTENILKGYIEDIWLLQTDIIDENENSIDITKIIKIYDNKPQITETNEEEAVELNENEPRIIESNENQIYINFQKHNNENNNQPIHVSIEVEDNSFYVFDTEEIEFDVNILYPYYKGELSPASYYTDEESYNFKINMYDEFTGGPANNYENTIINIELLKYETILTEENEEEIQSIQVYTWENVNINNGIINLNYQGNLLVDEYNMGITLITPNAQLYEKSSFIEILNNYNLSPQHIYLMDEPYIEVLNNKINGLTIDIKNEEHHIIITNIIIDEDNHIIIPDELKELSIDKLIIDVTKMVEEEAPEYINIYDITFDENNHIIIPDEFKEYNINELTIQAITTTEEEGFNYIDIDDIVFDENNHIITPNELKESNINSLTVNIIKTISTIDEDTGETIEIEELDSIIIDDIIFDSNNNIILPDEFEELGEYSINQIIAEVEGIVEIEETNNIVVTDIMFDSNNNIIPPNELEELDEYRIDQITIETTKMIEVEQEDIITITDIVLSGDNITLPDEFEQYHINKITIETIKTTPIIDENTEEIIDEKIEHIIIINLILDENNYIILPNEIKELGTYDVNIINTNTEENITYTYTIDEPYTYDYIYAQISMEEEYPDNPIEPIYTESKTSIIFNVKIDDNNHFNINDITDYIKIYEYNNELEYEYYGDNDSVTIIADALVNEDFKGVNTFWININGYEKTETFTLLDDNDNTFEILSDLEVGDIDVTIAYYKDISDIVNVSIEHNGEIIGEHSIDRYAEKLTFSQNFPESGYYTFVINAGDDEEIYTEYIDRNILKIQDLRFNDKIHNKQEIDELTCLGFGFTNENKANEDITITFWCDNPTNILCTKIINAQDSEYYVYSDIFLGNLEVGSHIIHIQYDGNSDCYQPFNIEKEIIIVKPTEIVYDKEFNKVNFEGTIRLHLLTLDSKNNIIQKGQYIINDVYYNLNEDIEIIPESIREYYVNITYIDDTNEYAEATTSIKYIVQTDNYDYYASSIIGDNTNDGTSPIVPVQNIEGLLEISQENDILCLMAGEYSIQTITRNTILYGYIEDNIENIRVNILEIAPGVTLTLYNLMLDTGNGYTPIIDSYELVNSGDETVELSTIPNEEIAPIQENIYKIKSKTRLTRTNPIIINGKILKNQTPIKDKLIELYNEDDILIKATMSDSDGKFTFSVDNDENNINLLTMKATNCEKIVLMQDIIRTYNWVFDGTETIQTIDGTVSTGDGVLTGGTGYVSDFAWSNNGLWELNCEVMIKNYNRLALYKENDTQRKDCFILQNNGYMRIESGGYNRLEIMSIPNFNLPYEYTPITIKKTSDTTVDIIWPNGTYTVTNNYWFAFSQICLGASIDTGTYIRNASVKYEDIILELETSYAPLLDGTEDIITTEGTAAFDSNVLWATNSYLNEGFSNEDFWEITLDATYWGYAQNTGISIIDKDIENNILHIRGDGEVWNKSGDTIFNDGVMSINSIILDRNSGFSTITIQRISPKTIRFKFDDSEWGKILWQSLPDIETLCIGIYRNVYNSGMGIKNINVKTEE